MSCGVGHRHGLESLWLWCRLVAAAPIRPLTWEPPCALGAALKSKNKNKSSGKRVIKHARSSAVILCLCGNHLWSNNFESFFGKTFFFFFLSFALLGPHPWHMEGGEARDQT